MDDLYREQILEHYKRPHNWGELDEPDLEFEDNNPLCGDILKVTLAVGEDNRVEDIRRDAMDEQVARMPRGLSFSAAVAANLAALGLGATLALLAWLASPLLTAGS